MAAHTADPFVCDTLDTAYPLDELLLPSACQRLFDEQRRKRQSPPVQKCSIVACPLRVTSAFSDSYTQPHWAHMSTLFLDLPAEWSHLDWLTWWRAITQYELLVWWEYVNTLVTRWTY